MRSSFLYGGESNCMKFDLNVERLTDFTGINSNKLRQTLNETDINQKIKKIINNFTPGQRDLMKFYRNNRQCNKHIDNFLSDIYDINDFNNFINSITNNKKLKIELTKLYKKYKINPIKFLDDYLKKIVINIEIKGGAKNVSWGPNEIYEFERTPSIQENDKENNEASYAGQKNYERMRNDPEFRRQVNIDRGRTPLVFNPTPEPEPNLCGWLIAGVVVIGTLLHYSLSGGKKKRKSKPKRKSRKSKPKKKSRKSKPKRKSKQKRKSRKSNPKKKSKKKSRKSKPKRKSKQKRK